MSISSSSSHQPVPTIANIPAVGAPRPAITASDDPNVITWRGHKVKQVVTKERASWIGKRGGLALLAPFILLGKIPAAIAGKSKEYNEAAGVNTLFNGGAKAYYIPVPGAEQALVQELGFDPKKQAEVVDYIKNNPQLTLRWESGHQYYIIPGQSRMIFLPGGDVEKARCIRFHEPSGDPVSDPDNANYAGRPVTGKELKKTALAYCKAYDALVEQGADLDHTIYINPFTKTLRGVADRLGDDEDETNETIGKWYNLDDNLWKDISDLWDENKTDSKDSLDGEKVDKKPVPPRLPFPNPVDPDAGVPDQDHERILKAMAARASATQAAAAATPAGVWNPPTSAWSSATAVPATQYVASNALNPQPPKPKDP